MIFHGMSDADVENIMKYPFDMFASDASIRVFNQGVPHPRDMEPMQEYLPSMFAKKIL
jgi:hypothetical protein